MVQIHRAVKILSLSAGFIPILRGRTRSAAWATNGLLVEFNSVVDAMQCAMAIQNAMAARPVELIPNRQIRFRLGLTVAARLESLAEPSGVNISRAVRDQIRDQLPVTLADLGEHNVANLARPVRAFRIVLDARPPPESRAKSKKPAAASERPSVAVLPFQNLGGDAEAEFFLDSVAEDLITELARARWFAVIARNTALSYKGKGTDSKQVSRELGVQWRCCGQYGSS